MPDNALPHRPTTGRTLLAVSITARDTSAALAQMESCAEMADVIELRLDLMEAPNLRALLESKTCPVIVTNRPVWEGGGSSAPDRARLALLEEAAELGAEHIDCELAAIAGLPSSVRAKTRLIVSSHDFAGMPDLCDVRDHCIAAGAHVAKAVGLARGLAETLNAFHALQNSTVPVIAIAMGETGLLSRLAAPRFGAYLTFGCLGKAQAAPGQVDIETMRDVYRVHEMTTSTRLAGWAVHQETPIPHAQFKFVNETLADAGHDIVVLPVPARSEADRMAACVTLAPYGFITALGATLDYQEVLARLTAAPS